MFAPIVIAAVAGVKQSDGSLLAHVVLVRHPLLKLAGEVMSVDLESSSFLLDTRGGEELSTIVDENTRFRSREGEIKGLEDLQPGMVVVVIAKQQWQHKNQQMQLLLLLLLLLLGWCCVVAFV